VDAEPELAARHAEAAGMAAEESEDRTVRLDLADADLSAEIIGAGS
jgi:hypothetical protein